MSPIFYICNANVVDARVRHTRRFPFFHIPVLAFPLSVALRYSSTPMPFATVSLKRLPFCIPSYARARACPPPFLKSFFRSFQTPSTAPRKILFPIYIYLYTRTDIYTWMRLCVRVCVYIHIHAPRARTLFFSPLQSLTWFFPSSSVSLKLRPCILAPFRSLPSRVYVVPIYSVASTVFAAPSSLPPPPSRPLIVHAKLPIVSLFVTSPPCLLLYR